MRRVMTHAAMPIFCWKLQRVLWLRSPCQGYQIGAIWDPNLTSSHDPSLPIMNLIHSDFCQNGISEHRFSFSLAQGMLNLGSESEASSTRRLAPSWTSPQMRSIWIQPRPPSKSWRPTCRWMSGLDHIAFESWDFMIYRCIYRYIYPYIHMYIYIYTYNIPYLPRTYIIIYLIYQLYHCLFTTIHPYLPPLLRKSYPHGTEVQRPGAFGSHLGAPCGWHRGAHTGAYTHG